MYKPCSFDRAFYLENPEVYQQVGLHDADNELCEFNEDAEDLAFELAYTRHYLAELEAKNAALEKRCAELERRNRVLDTQVIIFEHGYKRSMIQLQVIEDRADRAKETACVLASELEAMRKEAP